MTTPKQITFVPEEPIEVGGKTYSELTLVKLKAKHLVASDSVDGEQRKGFMVFAQMAGVPLGVIEELSVDDIARLSEEAAPLMGKSAQRQMEASKALRGEGEAGDPDPEALH